MSDKIESKRLSRRRFGALLASMGAVVPAAFAQQTTPQTTQGNTQGNPQQQTPPAAPQPRYRRREVPDTPPFEAPIEFTRKDVPAKAEPFPMAQVRVLPSNIFHDAEEWNSGYMSRLAADRLLYNFRANAGLPVG